MSVAPVMEVVVFLVVVVALPVEVAVCTAAEREDAPEVADIMFAVHMVEVHLDIVVAVRTMAVRFETVVAVHTAMHLDTAVVVVHIASEYHQVPRDVSLRWLLPDCVAPQRNLQMLSQYKEIHRKYPEYVLLIRLISTSR